jgi:hypothetical protein
MQTKVLGVILFCFTQAYGNDGGSEFIIKNTSQAVLQPALTQSHSMSKNKLKEEIGDVTRRAFNSSTVLGQVIGGVKISLADKFPSFYQIKSGKIASDVSKNDGLMQVELSGIQSSFSDIISNLVENRGFFKKASRGDLRDLLALMEEMVNNLNSQATSFSTLKHSMIKIDASKTDLTISDKVKQQFNVSACELKKLQDKIKTSKCFKKSA